MPSSVQKARIRQLDRQIEASSSVLPPRPRRGWVHAIRTALGMSMRQMAQRMGSNASSSVAAIERNEISGALTLRRLEAAADALDCDVAYMLVPREGSIAATLERRAQSLARQQVGHVHQHMDLEAQGVSRQVLKAQIDELAQILLWKRARNFWDGTTP